MATKFTDLNMQTMLSSRMGWNMDSPRNPSKYVHAVWLNASTIVLFVVHKERHTTMTDNPDLYPSDQLIMQLRVWLGPDETST